MKMISGKGVFWVREKGEPDHLITSLFKKHSFSSTAREGGGLLRIGKGQLGSGRRPNKSKEGEEEYPSETNPSLA